MQLSRDHKRYTYGQEGDLLKGEIKQTVPYLVYSLKNPERGFICQTHLVGGYNFDNAMAASAIGMHFGIDPWISKPLSKITGLPTCVPS